jgi:hypothetical protein
MWIGAGLALFGLLFAVAMAHQMREGARAMTECDAALARADLTTAISRARSAAEAAAPASPYPARAYERLASIARDAEAHGNEATAIAAWSAMRAAAIETRSRIVDTDRWRALADQGIARVGSTTERAGAEIRPTQAALADALARDDTPPAGRLALLALAAALFFAGAARIAWLGSAGKRSGLVPAASATLVGLALYLLACLHG